MPSGHEHATDLPRRGPAHTEVVVHPTMARPGVRVLAKVGWVVVALGAAWLATRGLGSGFLEFDPSRLARADRRAESLLALAGLLFVALAAVGRILLEAPTWTILLLGGIAVACWLATGTEVRFLGVPLLWPAVAGAAVGVVSQPPGPAAGRSESTGK